jgi:hypothetical protein
MLYVLNSAKGTLLWSTQVRAAILAPDEENTVQLAALGVGDGILVVPATNQLSAFYPWAIRFSQMISKATSHADRFPSSGIRDHLVAAPNSSYQRQQAARTALPLGTTTDCGLQNRVPNSVGSITPSDEEIDDHDKRRRMRRRSLSNLVACAD